MPKTIIPLEYSHLLGALLRAQVPYMFMLGCGYFFAKVGLLQKEGLVSFAKMNIEIFLPVYLFIQVCRSTFTYNLEENGVIIISFLFYFVIAFLLSFIYAFFSKMDIRYRFTFISITVMVDVKRLHYLYINSLCHLLNNKFEPEKTFCKDILVNSNVHIFFQGILIWYLCFNLIRMDRAYQRQVSDVWNKANMQELKTEADLRLADDKEDKEAKDYFNPEEEEKENKEQPKEEKESSRNMNSNYLSNEEKKKLKAIYNMYTVSTNKDIEKNNKDNDIDNKDNNKVIQVFARQSFYNKIKKYHNANFFKNDVWWKEIIYILLRSPIIALFIGFIVGFIRVIREWIYDTTTPVYLFFDTFNNIANCNILLGFLMIGANVVNSINENTDRIVSMHVRKLDYVAHLVIKVVIMPFLGVVFSYVINKHFFEDNRVLNWTCFIQWMLPTSIDIMAIVQLKDINGKFAGTCILLQYVLQMLFNNLVHVPCFLKVVNILDD